MKKLITCLVVCVLGGTALAENLLQHQNAENQIGLVRMISLNDTSRSPCISFQEREDIQEAIDRYRLDHPNRGGNSHAGELTFFPMGGNVFGDVFTGNFVDLDYTSGILDFACTNHSYDGHRGNDTGIVTFAEQEIGVPVFSATDGVVVYTHDGEYDHNTECIGNGNGIIVDHGGDLFGYYWHLKNGSVEVSVGETVVSGQQIGEVASSGCSTGPHLHFELRTHNNWGGETIEPYTDLCNPGTSYWENQIPIRYEPYMWDYCVTATPFEDWPDAPYRYPNDHQFALDTPWLYFSQRVNNFPASGTMFWKFYRPDGSLAFNWTDYYDNGEIWNDIILWWQWGLNDMHYIAGTWVGEFGVDDESYVTFDIEIVDEVDPLANHPPNPIDITLIPNAPQEDRVIECRVLGDVAYDDPDRDLVRYHYEWFVNDKSVRDVVIPAKKDVLRRDAAIAGDQVSVFVTASDGELFGNSNTAFDNVFVHCTGCDCPSDINGDGYVDVSDLLAIIDQWGLTNSPADLNFDGIVNVTDLLIVIGNWGECE